MTKDDELKESVKEPIKSLVKEIVSDTVYKLVKASAKKTVIELRDRLKEEATHRVEETLKEAAEKRLKQTAEQLEKEFTKDTPQSSEYIKNIEENLSKRLEKCLPPLKRVSPLITIALSCVCLLLILAGVYCCWIKPTPTPSPQPDLVISGITFQMDATDGAVPATDTELPADAETPTGEFDECPPFYRLTIHYVIENQGEAEAGQSTACLHFCGEVIAEDTVSPLGAGETADGVFNYYPLLRELFYFYFCYASVPIEIKVCADCGNEVVESNEENNCLRLEFNQPY